MSAKVAVEDHSVARTVRGAAADLAATDARQRDARTPSRPQENSTAGLARARPRATAAAAAFVRYLPRSLRACHIANAAMDATVAATQRQQAVVDIRSRTTQLLGSWVKDVDGVQIAMACATRAPTELLDFMLNAQHAKEAKKQIKTLAISQFEWAALFGAEARLTKAEEIGAKLGSVDKLQGMQGLASALRCTIAEKAQGRSWARAWTKAACLMAVHMEAHEETLALCLGNVVRADLRRLEDLRCEMDENGVGVMNVAQVLEALARSVT